jgi:lysophospholipase L1-like esterase
MKKTMIAACCAALLLTGCTSVRDLFGSKSDSQKAQESAAAETTVTTTSAPPPEHVLVTLGDSISAGYGLADAKKERYSALLTEKLTIRDGIEWVDCNYAVSGDDSTDLLKRLNDGKALRLPSADAVVICIGANNLLGPYSDYLKNAKGSFQINPEGLTSDAIGELTGILEKNKQAIETLKTDLEAGFAKMPTDLQAAYEVIRARNADAPIYLLNIYDPYSKLKIDNPVNPDQSFGDYSGELLTRMNRIIKDYADAHSDITYVDIAKPFAATDPIPILGNVNNYSITSGTLLNFDPHPNLSGQKLIADTLYPVIDAAQ